MDVIINRANKVYSMVTETPGKSRNLTRRCCDFKKLEEVSERYLHKNKVKNKNLNFSPLSRKTIQHNAKIIKNNTRTKNKNRNKNYDRNK